jgi:hypothetical protein
LKRYTDLEVAAHTVMIEGLPKNVPRRVMEQKIRKVFEQIISGYEAQTREGGEQIAPKEQVMQVSVISDYGKCLNMVTDLKFSAGKFKKCKQLNYRNLDLPDFERIKIQKSKLCGKTQVFDAEDYYKAKIEDLMFKIRVEEEF